MTLRRMLPVINTISFDTYLGYLLLCNHDPDTPALVSYLLGGEFLWLAMLGNAWLSDQALQHLVIFAL